MFMVYQDHLTKTSAVGKQPDSTFQVNLMSDLENEIQIVYGDVPVIIEIYKVDQIGHNKRPQIPFLTEKHLK